MIFNFLKIAIRHLLKRKGYSLINILGLSVGIACACLIILFVRDELSYDSSYTNSDHIYRVALDRSYPGRTRSYAIIPPSYAEAFQLEIPQVENALRLLYFPNNTFSFRYEGRLYEEADPMFADSTFFDFFDLPLLYGDPDQVLKEPNSAVLTRSISEKYFGKENPIGKTLEDPDGNQDIFVAGVCEDLPENTHLHFNILFSTTGMPFLQNSNYINFATYTYLDLEENADPSEVAGRFPEIVRKYASGPIERQFGVSYDDYVAAGNGYHYYLQPLEDIYLTSNLENEIKAPGSKTRVYIFSIIAAFILMIAVINFMNLATARSTERAKEVGIRKTMGSTAGQIAGQFLVEAVLISMVSMVVAIGLFTLIAPVFNSLSGKHLDLYDLISWSNAPVLIIFAIAIGLLSGSYPSTVLSGFKAISILKGRFSSTGHGIQLRNGLVVFQFTISVILIISTIIVYQQLQFVRSKELGFNKDQVLTLRGAGNLQAQTVAFKKELEQVPDIISVGACNSMPGESFFGVSFRKDGDNETTFGSGVFVDHQFTECLEMEIVDGRDFDERYNDTFNIVINEAAVRELDISDPVGKRISTSDDYTGNLPPGEQTFYYSIIGVVKDFHFQSLHQQISPVFFLLNSNPNQVNNLISIRLRSANLNRTIGQLEDLWHQFLPDQPFRYSFLDADLEELYQSEKIAQQVFGLFALLAIFIACMGLIGLAAFVTSQRSKEIGVRKVLGASVFNILVLLNRQISWMVILANLIAIPLTWYLMTKWLQNFAYHISINPIVFVMAMLLALVFAWLSVSIQSVKAALVNPIKSLRFE